MRERFKIFWNKCRTFLFKKVLNLTEDLRGAHLSDPILDKLKRVKKYDIFRDQVPLFYSYTNTLKERCFPILNNGSSFDYLQISGNEDLKKYFDSRHSDEEWDLYEFAKEIVHLLSLYGEAYYCIKWREKEIHGQLYILPESPVLLDLASMKRTLWGTYKQRYLFFSRFYSQYNLKNRNFTKDEIIHIKYPGMKSPLYKVLPFKKVYKQYYRDNLEYFESSYDQTKKELRFEAKRVYNYFNEKNRQFKAKERFVLGCFDELQDEKITKFYDIYSVLEHHKHPIHLREHVFQELQHQLVDRVKTKNNLANLSLAFEGISFTSLEGFNAILDRFRSGEITYEEATDIVSSVRY